MTVDQLNIAAINDESVENLVAILNAIYSSNNLLVLNAAASNLINYLTPFSRLKDAGKFQKFVWLSQIDEWKDAVDAFDGLILVVQDTDEQLVAELAAVVEKLPAKTKVYLVVQNLSKATVYQLEKRFKLRDWAGTGDDSHPAASAAGGFGAGAAAAGGAAAAAITLPPAGAKSIRLTNAIKVYNWAVNPIVVSTDDMPVLSLEEPDGGLATYFRQPVAQVSALSAAFIDLLRLSPALTGTGKMLKLQNIFAKGDHASLLVKLIHDEKLPDFLSSELNALEQQFYLSKLKGNTDLVVLERNLDYSSVAFSQLNYQGLIDDLFGVVLNAAASPGASTGPGSTGSTAASGTGGASGGAAPAKTLLNDELYRDLQHLNFASIGFKLNHLARAIQQEFSKKDTLQSVQEIKNLVSNLGPLTNKQELIKKHTEISESILNYIKYGNATADPTKTELNAIDEYEQYLEFQNDIFDLDYKSQVAKLREFLTKCYSQSVVVLAATLVSLFNDGLKERDYESVVEEMVQNYGIQIKFVLDNLIKYKVVKVVNHSSVDIFGAISNLSIRDATAATAGAAAASGLSSGGGANGANGGANTPSKRAFDGVNGYTDLNRLGITGAQTAVKTSYSAIDKFFNLHPEVPEEDAAAAAAKDGSLLKEYPNATFALPASTVPVLTRLVESLYLRDFLIYKPVNNLSRRPNWDNLGVDAMFGGKSVDLNLCDTSDDKKRTRNQPSQQQQPHDTAASSSALKYVVIVVLGGIARSEISCLRYLEQRINQDQDPKKRKKKFIVLTSGIVNSSKLLAACA